MKKLIHPIAGTIAMLCIGSFLVVHTGFRVVLVARRNRACQAHYFASHVGHDSGNGGNRR